MQVSPMSSKQTDQEILSQLINPERRSAVDWKFAVNNVGHKKWDFIAKSSLDDTELWTTLYECGKRNLAPDTAKSLSVAKYCGEELYQKIRPQLINNKFILGEKPIKIEKQAVGKKPKNGSAKGKSISKGDLIKQNNLTKHLDTELKAILMSNTKDNMLDNNNEYITFKSKFGELVFVRLMNHCRVICDQVKNLTQQYAAVQNSRYKDENEIAQLETKLDKIHREVSELVVGYNKIVMDKKSEPISSTCVEDLQKWIDYAKKKISFNSLDIIMKIPELIFKTKYDGMLQHKISGLYPYQELIFKFITDENANTPLLALVHTMLGSGKTSMILPWCGWLMANRRLNKSKLLFTCPNEIVLLEVAQMVYRMGVSFAIVIYVKEENKLEYKWSSFADKTNPKDTAVLYMCDIFVARILLEERNSQLRDKNLYLDANKRDPHNYPLTESKIPYVPDYILICDELTKDADTQNGFSVDSGFSLTTEVFIDTMKIAPPRIILMSATLPTYSQLPKLYNAIVESNPGMKIKSFTSSEAKIGCSLISAEGEIYAPHIGCETVVELKNVLLTIKSNPFIGRFYTVSVLLDMVNTFSKLSLPVPDLSILFDDPSKATQTYIQHIAYGMIETLIKLTDNSVSDSVGDSIGDNVGDSVSNDVGGVADSVDTSNNIDHLVQSDVITAKNKSNSSEEDWEAIDETQINIGNGDQTDWVNDSYDDFSSTESDDKDSEVGEVGCTDKVNIISNDNGSNTTLNPQLPADIIKQACTMNKTVGNKINLQTMLTTDIGKFVKGCFIFCSDPVTTAFDVYRANFGADVVDKIRLANLLTKYEKEMDNFDKNIKRVESKKDKPSKNKDAKNADNAENSNKVNNPINSPTDTSKIISDLMNKKPVWDFPEELQICSTKHLIKSKCDTKNISHQICPEDLPKNSNVSTDILTLLASGIAIYSTKSPLLDEEYLKTVIMLAKNRLIKFIFTDDSIAYGTNLAISNIVVIDMPLYNKPSIIELCSVKTILHMLGRIGRFGNSYIATIYTISESNNLINLFKKFIDGNLEEGSRDEIRNIGRAFDVIWSDTNARPKINRTSTIKKTAKKYRKIGTYGGYDKK